MNFVLKWTTKKRTRVESKCEKRSGLAIEEIREESIIHWNPSVSFLSSWRTILTQFVFSTLAFFNEFESTVLKTTVEQKFEMPLL